MEPIPRSPKGEKTKDLILQTAIKMASKEGIKGLSIGTLAKVVGMSKSGLFAHFNAKDNLQLMILKLATDLFVEKVLKPAFKEPAGEPRLRAFFEKWIKFVNNEEAETGGSLLISAFFELDGQSGMLRDYVQSVQKDLIRHLEKSIQIAIDVGHFKKGIDVSCLAWQIYSIVLGYRYYKGFLKDPRTDHYVRDHFEHILKTARRADLNGSSLS